MARAEGDLDKVERGEGEKGKMKRERATQEFGEWRGPTREHHHDLC
jgi:hypothetical protein